MEKRSQRSADYLLGERRTLFDAPSHRSTVTDPQKPGPATNPTVLIADDNDDTRQMFQTLLVGKGYRVIEASDGEQAVDLIQHQSPGLVLLDLGLPRLNGLSVIRRLRKDLGLIEVPLVVITGYDHHFESAVAAGCDDYLLKPIDFERLDAILDYYVPNRTHTVSA